MTKRDVLIGEITNLFPNLIRSKQISNPDRLLKTCRGIFISIVQSKNRFLWFLSLNIAFDIQNRRILYE